MGFYRPIDKVLTNTNIGTEPLNKKTKIKWFKNYRKCTLTEMLKVVIQVFLPMLYDRYVKPNRPGTVV